jgi:hypothetical protein
LPTAGNLFGAHRLTVIKRLLDIARRVAEGLDLRPITEAIASGTTQERLAAVQQLEKFSLKNREHSDGRELHARQLFEDIVLGKTRLATCWFASL